MVLCLALVAAACGGSVVDDRESGDDSTTSTGTGSGQGSSGSGLPKEPLGPCNPGFDPREEPGRVCNWVADGLCYDERDGACACECRRTDGDLCTSDFPGPPGSMTRVDCL